MQNFSNAPRKLPSPSKLFDIDSHALLDFNKLKRSSSNKSVLKHKISASFVFYELKNLSLN